MGHKNKQIFLADLNVRYGPPEMFLWPIGTQSQKRSFRWQNLHDRMLTGFLDFVIAH